MLFSIIVQFLHCLYLSISQKSERYRRKPEYLTSASVSIAMCVNDHLSVCMYTIPRDFQLFISFAFLSSELFGKTYVSVNV